MERTKGVSSQYSYCDFVCVHICIYMCVCVVVGICVCVYGHLCMYISVEQLGPSERCNHSMGLILFHGPVYFMVKFYGVPLIHKPLHSKDVIKAV